MPSSSGDLTGRRVGEDQRFSGSDKPIPMDKMIDSPCLGDILRVSSPGIRDIATPSIFKAVNHEDVNQDHGCQAPRSVVQDRYFTNFRR